MLFLLVNREAIGLEVYFIIVGVWIIAYIRNKKSDDKYLAHIVRFVDNA